jgi:predicted MPP superfamily phosphohydrolase
LLGIGATAAASYGYVRWAEPHWLELSSVEVPVSRTRRLISPIRVAHLSDFHASPVVSLDFIARSIALAESTRPDLIVVTGDFITSRWDDATRYAEILTRLPKTAPTFACLGNHDGGAWSRRSTGYETTGEVRALLQAAGITLLHNQTRALHVRGQALQLIGLGDLWSGECMPRVAFAASPPRADAVRLVLNHNPDAKTDLLPFDWDVLLCGHTHGGQIRLPFLGTPFAPVVDKRYVEGLHAWSDRWLHITRGVGNLHGIRFNCRPQVSLLTLV